MPEQLLPYLVRGVLSVACILDSQRRLMPVAFEVDYKFPKIDLADGMMCHYADNWLTSAKFRSAIVGLVRNFNCEYAVRLRRISV